MIRFPRPKSNQALPRLVVVGHGIASLRFCEEAVSAKLTEKFHIRVIGGEPHPAYDRVRLSQYVKAGDAKELIFHDSEWYAKRGIELMLGDPVEVIDPEQHGVRTASGRGIPYDKLVLATGSSAFVPPIPGVDFPEVHVYRTLADLDGIMAAAKSAKRAVVVGGGLLGLEAAQALEHLGLDITIVERAEFPMPRQLQSVAGNLVVERIRKLGLEFIGGFSTGGIVRAGSGIELLADDGRSLETDLVVISAGITPNSQIAADAGLRCGVRGGVIVDDGLQTSDDDILAIGECALHHGQIYGLAAPAAAMAKHAVHTLAGHKPKPFQVPDLSTRLKMLGVEVTTIGNPLDRGTVMEYRDGDRYRMVALNTQNVPVGAIAIGAWPEGSLVHGWYIEQRAIRFAEIERFTTTGMFDAEAATANVLAWPDERLVCSCTHVTKGALCHAMALGACTPKALAEATGASTVCGSCLPLVEELCGAPVSQRRGLAPTLLIGLSVFALIILAGVLTITVPAATSVEGMLYVLQSLWNETLPKQITGYSLLGVSLLGLLISLRKRLPKFRVGAFASWRVFHAAFGLVSLAVLFAHTGFRFGSNLNATLMTTFVGLNLLGALAGIAAGLETRGNPRAAGFARRMRPGLTVAHYVLFWPLPVLLGFHIASAYLY